MNKTWLFATSSLGLLTLASQCNHEFPVQKHASSTEEWPTHHIPSRSVHEICQAHRSFRESGLSWTFSRSGQTPSLRAQQPLTSPAVSQQTRSPLGHPRWYTWAEEVRLRTRPFQHLFGATVSRCQFWSAPRQSSVTAMSSLKTRSSEPSCQRYQPKHWFVIVLHMKSVTPTRLLKRMNLK